MGGGTSSRSQWMRRLASRRRNTIAFALSGGGPLGALQAGALTALLDRGVVPDLVTGTSAGALNAAAIAFDPTLAGAARLLDLWRGAQDGELFAGTRFISWARVLVRGNRVLDNVGLRRFIVDSFGEGTSIEEAAIPLGIVATRLEDGEERVFTYGPIVPALLASTALPGALPPVEVEGDLYVDGGVVNNVPVAPAIHLGATTVYVLDTTATAHARRPLHRPIDYLLHCFALARAQRFRIEQAYLAQQCRIVVVPTPRLDFHVPFGSMTHTDRLIELGYQAAARFLDHPVPAVASPE